MNEGLLFLLLIVAGVSLYLGGRRGREREKQGRRDVLLATPLSIEWRGYLEANVPLYQRIPENLKQQVEGHTQVLLSEIVFEGHGGLTMSDEIRVTIAGQASFLLLNQKCWFPDSLRAVIVYPGVYMARTVQSGVGELYTESEQPVLGQSWDAGVVVLSWDNARHTAANPCDGHNLVLHEFAHQLDQATGAADGAPVLEGRPRQRDWWRALSQTYADFNKDLERGSSTVMNDYGATNPAEFFAVATETFFEKPRQLRDRRPELYNELCYYYRTDPLEWPG